MKNYPVQVSRLPASIQSGLTEITKKTAVDNAIVGIIDSISCGGKYIYNRSDGEY